MSATLSGFVRMVSADAWHRQIGVVTNTPNEPVRGWVMVKFGNGQPLAFDVSELEQLDTEQAQALLAKEHNGN
jgi:hypothetical protein